MNQDGWKGKLRNPFVQQYLIEIVFPLVGYFFFDWNIWVIAIYYFFDQLGAQILFYGRAFIVNKKAETTRNLFGFFLSIIAFFLLFVFEICIIGTAVMQTQVWTINKLETALIDFLVSEGWLLFPVLLLAYHLKDQFSFYMPRHYLKYDMGNMLKWNLISNVVIVLFIGLGTVIWRQFTLSNSLVIISFVVFKVAFDLLKRPFVLKKMKKSKI